MSDLIRAAIGRPIDSEGAEWCFDVARQFACCPVAPSDALARELVEIWLRAGLITVGEGAKLLACLREFVEGDRRD